MKKLVTAMTIGLLLSNSAIGAERTEQESKNEMIGLGSGVLVGAAIAGPVGAIVAGVMGIMIADDVNDENKLELAEAKLDRQNNQLVALTQQYQEAKKQSQIQIVAMDSEIENVVQETEANIQFRTASYEIEEHFKPQLDLLVEGLLKNPGLVVNLSGYADRRGDDTYNQALSEQRVISVKQYLVKSGVDSKQVLTNSFGETNPVSENQTFEADFFDRRVLVRLEEAQDSMTASN